MVVRENRRNLNKRKFCKKQDMLPDIVLNLGKIVFQRHRLGAQPVDLPVDLFFLCKGENFLQKCFVIHLIDTPSVSIRPFLLMPASMPALTMNITHQIKNGQL